MQSGAYGLPAPSGTVRPPGSNAGTTQMLADRIYLAGVIEVREAKTLDQLHAEIHTVGDGAAVVRLATAPFTDGGVLVGQTLTEHGSIDGTSATLQSITGIGHALGPGRVALLAVANGETATAPTVRSFLPEMDGVALPAAVTATRHNTTPVTSSDQGGSMPATVPAFTTQTSNGCPAIGVTLS